MELKDEEGGVFVLQTPPPYAQSVRLVFQLPVLSRRVRRKSALISRVSIHLSRLCNTWFTQDTKSLSIDSSGSFALCSLLCPYAHHSKTENELCV